MLPDRKTKQRISTRRRAKLLAALCAIALFTPRLPITAAETVEDTETVRARYEEYNARFDAVEYRKDITEKGFEIVDIHIFPVQYEID